MNLLRTPDPVRLRFQLRSLDQLSRRTLKAIWKWHRRVGYPPTIAEIAEDLNFAETTIRTRMSAMVQSELLLRKTGKNRTWRVSEMVANELERKWIGDGA